MYIFYQQIGERLRNALLVSLLTVAFISILSSTEQIFVIILFVPLTVLFLLGSVFLLYQLFSRKPKLVIDDKGISVNLHLFFGTNRFFPWGEIGGVTVYTDQIHYSGFTFNRVRLFIKPINCGRFSPGVKPQVMHRWFRWGHLDSPYAFEFTQKGLDADAIRTAIQSHGKLYK